MSTTASFFVATLYLLVAATIAVHEYRVIVKNGGDSFTVILAFVFIYLLLPSIGIHALLGAYGNGLRTGNDFFDKVLSRLDLTDSLMVCLLTFSFILGLYLSAGFGRTARRQGHFPSRELQTRRWLVFSCIGLLTFVCGKFFMGLGENFLERYAALILFRNQDPSSVRTFFSANAFSLTQTLTWLAAGVFFIYFAEKKRLNAAVYFAIMLSAAFLMGSRRGLIFPVLIIYLCSVLLSQNLHFRKLAFFVPLIVLWVSFGKELTGSIAYDVETDAVLSKYESAGSALLRALSDIGISQIQSLAILQHFEVAPRFGVDHLLSALRRIPDGMIGLDIDWPERVVRITTEAFASSADADIPPGLIGQSWLDFPVVGALMWGVFIGIQSWLLNRWASRVTHSPAKVVFVVLLSIVIALPINSGSLDFTFSVDIIVLVLLMAFFFRTYSKGRSPSLEGPAHD